MQTKPLFFLFMLLLFTLIRLPLEAQNFNDALRYSQYDYYGTARSAGVAGSLGPLGADFSVISTNPAGLAWIRRSQFVITPMFNLYTGKTRLINGSGNPEVKETSSNLSLATFGLVVSSRSRNPNWRTVNFSLGFNRLADFNRRTVYRGASQGSIVNRFSELANSDFGLDDFESGLAFDAEVFILDPNSEFYFSDFDGVPEAVIEREQVIQTSGGVNELSFAFSGNYNDQLLIGLGVGLPFINYIEEKEYRESDINNEVPAFEDLQFDENLTTTGVGFNAKLGIIYRATQMIRVGAAIHTPTWYSLEDNFSTAMVYSYTEGGTGFIGSANSPDGNFRYRLKTPWRFSGGVGLLFGRSGFITGEVEWVDYSNNTLGFDSFAEDEDIANRDIAATLSSSLNLRVGGEYALDKYRFRAGVSLRQPPFEDKTDLPSFDTQLSLGAGLNLRSFFLDLALRRSMTEEVYSPYLTSTFPQQFFENTTNYNRILLTLGFRF